MATIPVFQRLPSLDYMHGVSVTQAIFYVLLLLLFAYVGTRLIWKRQAERSRRFLEQGLKAEATITEKYFIPFSLNAAVIFRFYDARGNMFQGKLYAFTSRNPSQSIAGAKAGDKFTIVYNPHNPREHHPEIFLKRWQS